MTIRVISGHYTLSSRDDDLLSPNPSHEPRYCRHPGFQHSRPSDMLRPLILAMKRVSTLDRLLLFYGCSAD